MSRVGKKPVAVPSGVQASVQGGVIAIKGPKGELKRPVPPGMSVAVDKGTIVVTRPDDERGSRAKHGLTRALIQNMIDGVTKGYERKLEINGVGYKAEVAGDTVTLALGYSHPIAYTMPKGVTAKVEKNILTLTGIDKEAVGRCASTIRSFRKPEPYKGKGVKYIEEQLKRKVGKAGATA